MSEPISLGNREKAVVENSVHIAQRLERICEIEERNGNFTGTQDVIFEYVIPWACEAQEEYERTEDVRIANCDYLEWIDGFITRKMSLLEGRGNNA